MYEDIQDYKKDFVSKFESLPEDRQKEILEFYSKKRIESLFPEIKNEAQRVIDYADRRGYGYGEVGYNINEAVKDFAEDVPELEKEYKRLINAYFNMLVDAIEA